MKRLQPEMALFSLVLLLLVGFSSVLGQETSPVPASTEAPSTEAPSTEAPTSAEVLKTLSVECTHEYMMAILEHQPNHGNLDMDKITLKDVSCTMNDLGEFNATHLWMKAPLDGCLTNHSTSEDTITYMNSIIAETRASAGSVLISREFQAEFPFKCSYPRSAIMSVASFSPREKVIYTRTAEFGNFTFTMDMYKTNQYLEPYDSYPVEKKLNEKIHLEVKVKSNDSKLVLIPERCWATPSQDPEDSKFFAFIDKGCGEDETLVFNYEENAVQRFTLGAFRFLQESTGSTVYLHCAVEACRKGDNESRCAEGCIQDNSRKRRTLERDIIDAETVSVGPLTAEDIQPREQAQESGSSLTVIGAVAGVLGVVVLALIVALVVLYKRYHTPQQAGGVVYSKASNDENKMLV